MKHPVYEMVGTLFWWVLQDKLMADVYAADDTLSRRAQPEVSIESLICILPFFLRSLEELMNLMPLDL